MSDHIVFLCLCAGDSHGQRRYYYMRLVEDTKVEHIILCVFRIAFMFDFVIKLMTVQRHVKKIPDS